MAQIKIIGIRNSVSYSSRYFSCDGGGGGGGGGGRHFPFP